MMPIAAMRLRSASGGGGSFLGAMDAYETDMRFAFGINRLLASYSGPLLRVRRSSDDAEQDINYLSDGSLNTSALASFGGSDSCYVTKWYGQTGGRDAVQATHASQPRIVNAGVYDGGVLGSGAQNLTTSASSSGGTALSTAGRMNMLTNSPTQVMWACGTGAAGHSVCQIYVPGGFNQLHSYTHDSSGTDGDGGTSSVSIPTGDHVWATVHQMSAASTALAARLFYDGGELVLVTGGTAPPGVLSAEPLSLFCSVGGSDPASVKMISFCLWEVNQAANMLAISTAFP